MSTMADAIRIIFMIVVGIVFFIAVMIVINTLVVSVLERIAEIGTMRALGAQKKLIRKLFNYEVFLLSSISGLMGIALGGITILIVKACHIEANNGLTYILFSGNYLNPVPDFFTLFGPMIAVILAGFAANLYPLHVAGGIEPVEAMREE
jgi:putative ABC transport system permease protein